MSLGGYALERKWHEQFVDLLAHGHEWFRPGPEALEHLNGLRKKDGVPLVETSEST